MSIALERNKSNPIQRSKFMQCVLSVYDSPDTKAFTGDRRFPVEREGEDSSSSSSSIGRNSDSESDGEHSNEAQSSYKGPLESLNALEQVLPIKRGISSFYNGKSKSFTSLADVSSALSVEELAKPEDPYTRKRKNLMAHNNLFDKNHNYQCKSNGSGTSKKPANSGRSTMVLGMAMKGSVINHSEDSNLVTSSHLHHLPPLHPQGKRSPSSGSPPSPPRRNSPWRSFSLSDLQCVTAGSHNITGLAFPGGHVDNKEQLPAVILLSLSIVLVALDVEVVQLVATDFLATINLRPPQHSSRDYADLLLSTTSNEHYEDLAIWKIGFGCCYARPWFILVVSLHRHSTAFYHILHTMAAPFVSDMKFKMFHEIDRELYTLLTITLWRDPVESIQIMALWLWLERTSLIDVVSKILPLPYLLINELADEAVTCLNCINNDHFACSSENYDIPLTQSVTDTEISLRFFHENRLKATEGVAKVVNDVCIRPLNDIMQKAVDRNAAQNMAYSQKMMAQPFQQSSVHPGFSQMRFGPRDVLKSRTQENEVPTDGRTMFVTFSKGYPVQESEVREFFTRAYGDCIETLVMQDVQSSEQSLFAKIVFRSTSIIDVILNGMGKVKFTINGKHVWARKYFPNRRPKSLLMPPLPPV